MTKKGCSATEVWPSVESGCRLGQYDGLAATDITELNLLYCSGTTTTESSCADDPDVAYYCPYWANYGFCTHTYIAYMTKYCALSCGLC